MGKITPFRFLCALVTFTVLVSSCATSSTYSQRKKAKYNSSSTVVKSKKSKSRTRTSAATRPSKNKRTSSARSAIVNTAKRYIGTKYVYGGKAPGGFDCSGLTAYVYQHNGVELTGASHTQARAGRKVTKSNLQVGDLIFFGKGKVSHVGIVAEISPSSLKIIHSSSSKGVVLEDIIDSRYWQSRYLFGRDIISGDYATR